MTKNFELDDNSVIQMSDCSERFTRSIVRINARAHFQQRRRLSLGSSRSPVEPAEAGQPGGARRLAVLSVTEKIAAGSAPGLFAGD